MASPRVWLITGTSSGFGSRLVSIVLARGDRVIATAKTLASITHFLDSENEGRADSDPDRKQSKSKLNLNVHCAELDISVGTERVKERVDAIVREAGWGRVDVLVNNAGTGLSAFVEEGGTDLMRQQYETNVFGTLDVTLAVLPYMREQRSGTVVMMGSRSGWKLEIQGMAFYGSSKAALHAISETLAVELESFGIRVLIVQPGAFRTEGIYRNTFYAGDSPLGPLADYDPKRESVAHRWMAPAGKQRGDPAKAMHALVEVVCGEGRASGRGWPLYLVLGQDAEQDVRNKCARMIGHLDEWGDVVRDVDLDLEDY